VQSFNFVAIILAFYVTINDSDRSKGQSKSVTRDDVTSELIDETFRLWDDRSHIDSHTSVPEHIC